MLSCIKKCRKPVEKCIYPYLMQTDSNGIDLPAPDSPKVFLVYGALRTNSFKNDGFIVKWMADSTANASICLKIAFDIQTRIYGEQKNSSSRASTHVQPIILSLNEKISAETHLNLNAKRIFYE
jgi:hypothetical protein